MRRKSFRAALHAAILLVAGCEGLTDAATRLAADLEQGARGLGHAEGDTLRVDHATPSRAGECDGPYKVQLDRVGALIVWCYDDTGTTVSSHSTSAHARSVETARTFLVSKGSGESLRVTLMRQGRRATITDVE